MKEIYFLVDNEGELKKKIWDYDYFWEDILGGAALRIKEINNVASEENKRLFKVWIEKSYISCNPTSSSIVYTVPYQTPTTVKEGVVEITC